MIDRKDTIGHSACHRREAKRAISLVLRPAGAMAREEEGWRLLAGRLRNTSSEQTAGWHTGGCPIGGKRGIIGID